MGEEFERGSLLWPLFSSCSVSPLSRLALLLEVLAREGVLGVASQLVKLPTLPRQQPARTPMSPLASSCRVPKRERGHARNATEQHQQHQRQSPPSQQPLAMQSPASPLYLDEETRSMCFYQCRTCRIHKI